MAKAVADCAFETSNLPVILSLEVRGLRSQIPGIELRLVILLSKI